VVGCYGSGADLLARSLEVLGLPRGDPGEIRQLHEGVLRHFGSTLKRPRLPWRWEGTETGHTAVSGLRFALANLVDEGKSVISDPSMCLFPKVWQDALVEMDVKAKAIVVTRDTEEMIEEMEMVFPGTSYGELRWLAGEIDGAVCNWTTVFRGDLAAVKHEDLHKERTFKEIRQSLNLDWPELLSEKWADIEALEMEGVH
jgi:hypothetical protein